VPEYNVTVEVIGKGGKKSKTLEITKPFTEWFDAAGHFVVTPFQSVLATGIPAIGKADPKRVANKEVEAAPAYTTEMLDALTKSSVSAAGSGAETASGAEPKSAKKGERRRKA